MVRLKLLLVFVAVLLVSSCQKIRAPYFHSDSVEIPWTEQDLLAVGFLGYYTDFESFIASPNYGDIMSYYPQIGDLDLLVNASEGDELYVVVPRDNVKSLLLTESERNDGFSHTLYEEESMPFLVLCNSWDLHNVKIAAMDEDGNTIEYQPMIDEEGCLRITEGIVDISVGQPKPLEGLQVSEYQDSLMTATASVVAGRVYLDLDLSRMPYDEFRSEYGFLDGHQHISEINGYCKGVTIMARGREKRPTIGMIMENGDIQVMDVINMLENGDPTAGGRIPSIKNAVGFFLDESDGRHTMMARTLRDGDHRIPFFRRGGIRYSVSKDGKKVYNLFLGQDWKMEFSVFDEEGNNLEDYIGRFIPSVTDEEQEGGRLYKYHFTYSYLLDEDEVVNPDKMEGNFLVARGDYDALNVTSLSGMLLGSERLGMIQTYLEGYWPGQDDQE